MKMSLEKDAYKRFIRKFDGHGYPNQRLGQAFYNEFNLHRMKNQEDLQGLYELDGVIAEAKIKELFQLD